MEQQRHIQDRILEFVYKQDASCIYSLDLSYKFSEDQEYIFTKIKRIIAYNEKYLQLTIGKGDSEFSVTKSRDVKNEVYAFLDNGGFTGIELQKKLDKEAEKNDKVHQRENWKVTTRAAKISWWAIVIAMLSLIVASMALYLQWKGK